MPDEEIEDIDLDVCGNINALASAYSSLEEIDGAIMSSKNQKKLGAMKKNIFNALYYYSTCLPEIDENTKEV